MSKYYICITSLFPSDDSFRGAYIFDQVKAIERCSDYKVIVLVPTPFYIRANDYEFNGIRVYRFKDYTLPSNIWPNHICDKLSVRSMLQKLNLIGVNVSEIAVAHGHVTHNGAFAIALKHFNNSIKTVVQHHGFDVMSLTDGKLANYEFHKKQCIRYGVKVCNEADLNIGVSNRTLDYLKSIKGVNLKDEYILYNGVDTTKFATLSCNTVKKGNFTIGCVANFWELKDQMTLIRSVERLIHQGYSNIKVIFIGTGYTLQKCKDYIKQNNLFQYFEFRLEINHNQLPDFYRSLNLFVLPSYWEAFGCVYTEAFACGIPFIGVKGQGIAEIIAEEDKQNWLIDRGDDGHLSELIKRCIDNTNLKNTISIPIDIDTLVKHYLRQL